MNSSTSAILVGVGSDKFPMTITHDDNVAYGSIIYSMSHEW